jgi:hypothetical protein
MIKVCLVACASTKTTRKTAAQDLYKSPLFQKARAYATTRFDRWYILSARHGLLDPKQQIEPYDQTLNKMSRDARAEWAESVFQQILEQVKQNSILAFVAGERYREGLLTSLQQKGYKTVVPLEGLSIGMQLSWLNRIQTERERLQHLDEFYSLLTKLEKGVGGKRVLKECTGGLAWPEMGVYFFFGRDEYRSSDVSQERVVRVGTHTVSRGSKSTLWNRLRTHRGALDGSGNHRGSIFRLHVGAAIINHSEGKIESPKWGAGEMAGPEVKYVEAKLEQKVSEYIGALSLLWLAIEDEPSPTSDRAFIEQNAIALLSGYKTPIDLPGRDWLGRRSSREAIRRSGLWNVNYVEDAYDPRFLGVMAQYVDVTLGKSRPPQRSIAPTGWSTAKRGRGGLAQISLFNEE